MVLQLLYTSDMAFCVGWLSHIVGNIVDIIGSTSIKFFHVLGNVLFMFFHLYLQSSISSFMKEGIIEYNSWVTMHSISVQSQTNELQNSPNFYEVNIVTISSWCNFFHEIMFRFNVASLKSVNDEVVALQRTFKIRKPLHLFFLL